jgi:putative transposase
MPRPLREIESGVIYHVLNRGNNRNRIFHKPQDYQAFLNVVAEGLKRFGVDLLSWCLMPNHWHLVLRPRGEGQLQAFMQWITITHVRRHHGHYDRASGHLYQGRYKHFPVQDDSYFLTLCRYVEANPLRAKLVEAAQEWRWSSLWQRLNKQTDPSLSDWPLDRPSRWTALVNEEMEPKQLKQLREHVIRDRPLGDPRWMQRIAKRLGLAQTLHPRGRPPRPIESLAPRQRRRREKRMAKSDASQDEAG